MKPVFLLNAMKVVENHETCTTVGIFSPKEKAEQSMARFQNEQVGSFASCTFSIVQCFIDQIVQNNAETKKIVQVETPVLKH